jgi:hypothetical protein
MGIMTNTAQPARRSGAVQRLFLFLGFLCFAFSLASCSPSPATSKLSGATPRGIGQR